MLKKYSKKFKSYNILKFELKKIWNNLNRCAKILINQPNVSIFLGCVGLRKTDNQLFIG